MQVVFENTCESNALKLSLNTTLYIGDNQLHVSAMYTRRYPQAEYRFIIGEKKHYSSLNCIMYFSPTMNLYSALR